LACNQHQRPACRRSSGASPHYRAGVSPRTEPAQKRIQQPAKGYHAKREEEDPRRDE